MKITIGELTEFLAPWSTKIEILMINDKPLMRAYLSGSYGTTRVYLYITQKEEFKYQCIESDDDICKRFLLTGRSSDPFIKESNLASDLFGKYKDKDENDSYSFKDNLDYKSFNDYLLDVLFQYGIIRFDPNSKKKSLINDMGFNSSRIKRILMNRMKEYHSRNNSIGEFMFIIMNKKQAFDLYPMAQKEINCIFAMLKNLGLDATIDKNIITKLDYSRR